MWFLWLALALTLAAAGGLYVRRRVVAAAGALGVGRRGQAALRWGFLWLLFAYPAIVLATVAGSLALGRDRIGGYDGPVATWLLGVPFFLTVLVVVQALPWLLVVEGIARARRRGGAPATRRHALAVLAPVVAFAIYTPARIAWERGEVRWRHHTIAVSGEASGAPAADRPPPFRIAFLADLQQDADLGAARAAAIVARINETRPDLVLSGGDWINTGPAHIEAAARTAGALRGRLGTYSVLGDHEHFAYVDRARSAAEVTAAMRRHGVAMLDNEVVRFDHHGRSIAVVLLTYSYPARTPPDELERLIAAAADADVSVLVTHQLDADVAARARDRIDLVLAGHTHGGQINPVLGLWHVPLARLETPYVDGRYRLGRTTIVVTAGVGYSLVPLRYAAPGSVETIDLVW